MDRKRTFHFSPRITIVSVVLAALMLRLSYWQWERYGGKLALITRLEENLAEPPVPIESIMQGNPDWSGYIFRRVVVHGRYDFEHEMVLRNRRMENNAGMYVLTPLMLPSGRNSNSDNGDVRAAILVNRGFVRLKDAPREARAKMPRPTEAKFVGILKAPLTRRFLGPKDPPGGPGLPWVDEWLRIDLSAMEKQLPYPLLPLFVEVIPGDAENLKAIRSDLEETRAGREEMFFLPTRANESEAGLPEDLGAYPIPVFDTFIPPGRHLGYVYEWAIMAGATLLIGVFFQFRRAG